MAPAILYPSFPPIRIQEGQWIKTVGGPFEHHGIVVRAAQLNPWTNQWETIVAHTGWGAGVITTSLSEFAQGRPIQLVKDPTSDAHSQWVVATARANFGKPYLLSTANCEHFASFCYSHKAESQQLQTAGLVFGALLGVVAIAAISE